MKKVKVLSIFFILFIVLIFYYNFNICNFKRLLISSNTFGFKYSLSHCNKITKAKIYQNIKNFFLDTSFEIYLRSYIDSGDYIKINTKKINELKKNEKIINELPSKIEGINKKNKLFTNKIYKKKNKEWTRSHGGNDNLKFANYSEINLESISKLELLWTYKETGSKFAGVQLNPVFNDNIIYLALGNGKMVALNSDNGKKLWSIQSIKNITTRGIVLDKEDKIYLYVPIQEKIFKINASTGKIKKNFGDNGSIKILTKSAPIIYSDKICAAQMSPAVIKCFDKLTGELIFDVNIHPQKKEFINGGTIWSNIAFDEKKEIAFVGTGNPRPALVGLNRQGKNKNANSIIAIDLKNRKLLWTHQDVIHDLWDYDLSAPPTIIDLKLNNQIFPGLIVISKIGNVYLFNRETGQSYYDIDYKKVPLSNVPGENNSYYQVKIDKPAPLQKLNIGIEDLNSKTIKLNKTKIDLGHFDFGAFNPPKLGGEVIINGLHGGVSWTGFSVNPNKNIIFTPINNLPYRLKLETKTYSRITIDNEINDLYLNKCSSCHGKFRNGTFQYSSSYFNVFEERDYQSKYIPSLAGHSIFNPDFEKLFSFEYINSIHNTKLINKKEEFQLKKLFSQWDKSISNNSEFFFKYNWTQFMSGKKTPAIKPPWGEIVALDIITGNQLWKKPIGKFSDKVVGTPIYGGLATNNGDILIATGTQDKLVYFINQNNGEILKTFKMNAPGSSPPIIYKSKTGEKITIVSGTMRYPGFEGNAVTQIYTFGIK